jgi:hypothetical protein
MQDFEPPIQNLEAIDIVAKRRDGGVDLMIVCSGPLDGSADTLGRLERKVTGYLAEIPTEGFRHDLGPAEGKSVRILIACEHSISALAAGMINTLTRTAQEQGVELLHVSSYN